VGREREAIQTLGGLVMPRSGRVPARGDSVTLDGVRLEVADMDGRRVDQVLATRLPESSTVTAR